MVIFVSLINSLNNLLSSFLCVNAGFKSIDNSICCFLLIISTIFLDIVKITGPDIPCSINNNSPNSLYKYLLSNITDASIFFKLKPAIFISVSIGTSDGLIFSILWPISFAIKYPSPVEPVKG